MSADDIIRVIFAVVAACGALGYLWLILRAPRHGRNQIVDDLRHYINIAQYVGKHIFDRSEYPNTAARRMCAITVGFGVLFTIVLIVATCAILVLNPFEISEWSDRIALAVALLILSQAACTIPFWMNVIILRYIR